MTKPGKRIRAAKEVVSRTKLYPLDEAVKLVKDHAKSKFDETVEVAMNLGVDPRQSDQMVRGVVSLPNGSGRGALPPDEAAKAPYLVELKPNSPFTDWLLLDASATMENWGVLVVSALGLRQLREHLRDLNEAQTPQGQRFTLRWYDRSILRVLLPSLSAPQLLQFFGPITAIAQPTPQAWTWWRESVGQLMTDTRTLAG